MSYTFDTPPIPILCVHKTRHRPPPQHVLPHSHLPRRTCRSIRPLRCTGVVLSVTVSLLAFWNQLSIRARIMQIHAFLSLNPLLKALVLLLLGATPKAGDLSKFGKISKTQQFPGRIRVRTCSQCLAVSSQGAEASDKGKSK